MFTNSYDESKAVRMNLASLRNWNNGLPWRELPGKLFCRCKVSEADPMECQPCMPGLGQGIVEFWNDGFSGIGSFLIYGVIERSERT